jgi:tRNA(fMet)-specific endonuclease VapC
MGIRYFLDTCTASYAINKKSPFVDRHLAKVPMAELAVSSVTEGELRYGLARHHSLPLQLVIDQFLSAVTVLPWDSDVAREYGELHAELEREGRKLGGLDMMIAAHALAIGAILVSSDSAFKRVKKLKVEDWNRA